MRTLKLLAVAVTFAALALTACRPAQGPAGTVVDRDRTYWSATKQWTYKLTVEKADGGTAKFKVLRDVYKACSEGEAYPGCVS
ncbi:hypothetical protein [Streptomyces canus]|uniref:hypothetical protein n=1 Tax=Streptomyces canus TaxID=58343 RepID=UPI002783DF9C|nr:hypothetical protein [Streptomyces canus]MDQ0758732.1 hypothetical protein [Streptomyces canus]